MSKKILIFHTAIGQGHKYMALNIADHLRQLGYEVRLEDIHKVQPGKLVNVSTKVYLWLIETFPAIWKWFYMSKLLSDLTLPHRLRLASKYFDSTKKLIDGYNPDLVIADQTTASAVVSYLKLNGLYTKPFGIGFSDFHLHRYWLYDQADFYLANIQEQKDEMIRLGIAAEKIFVVGMTLQRQPEFDKAQLRAKYSIPGGAKSIIISGGSLGFGLNKQVILNITNKLEKIFHQNFRMFVVCGTNQQLFNDLATLKDSRITVYGFYNAMSELYAVCDLFVGKPGGLSTTEALHYRLPIVVTHWMPGGEELNVNYLMDKHLIIPVHRDGWQSDEMLNEVVTELNTGAFKKSLEQRPGQIDALVNQNPQLIGKAIEYAFSKINPQA